MKFVFISIFLFTILVSCDSEDRYLGRLPVKNNDDVYFELYQEQKFDNAVGVIYKIMSKTKGPLLGPRLLIGTSDFDREDTRDFTAGSYNSIVYLTFLDSNKVYAIYDTKTNRSIDITNLERRDTLLEVDLKKHNPRLKFSWYE